METVKFTQLKDGDREDFEFLFAHDETYAGQVGERLLKSLLELDASFSSCRVEYWMILIFVKMRF